jgi:PST family polysaccharide transporter
MIGIVNRGRRGARAAIDIALLATSNVIRLVAQLILLPVLARLITPGDYGLFAIAMPVITLCVAISSGGLDAALVRAPKGQADSTALWAAVVIALLFVVLLLLTAPVAGAVLGLHNLGLVVAALSLRF